MAVAVFMESPLITWVRTFSAEGIIEFHDIEDGIFLHDVLAQIDERGEESKVNRLAKDSNARIQNWNKLLLEILVFYQDVLQQMVVMELPDTYAIVKHPTKESSLKEIQKFLLLLLGCAVQSPGKENFIEAITRLDINTQQAIMDHIKQITDGYSVIVSKSLLETPSSEGLSSSIKCLIKERDRYSQRIVELVQERDYHKTEVDKRLGPLTPPACLELHHLVREVNRYKTQVSHLSDELEEKVKVLSEVKDELASLKQERAQLKQQNLVLSKDAKAARAYRDELDSLKEQALKAEKLEKEVCKYKEKLNELDFFKSRVEELREDNWLLSESKAKAEEQLTVSNKRLESLLGDLERLQAKLEETSQEKELLNKKVQELVEENTALELERNGLREGGMRRFQSSARFLTSSQISLPGLAITLNGNAISEELNETMFSQVTRLERENEELRHELEEAQGQLGDTKRTLQQVTATSDLDYRNKVDQLQLETSAMRHRLSQELSKEYRIKFEENMNKQNEQVKMLMRDHHQTVASLRQREAELLQQLAEMQSRRSQEQQRDADRIHQEITNQLQQSIETVKAEREDARKETEAYQKKAMQAHRYAETMKKERDSAHQALTHTQVTTQSQIAELQSKMNELQKINEQLQENFNQLNNQNGGYDSGIDESRHSPKSGPQNVTPTNKARPHSVFVNPQDVLITGVIPQIKGKEGKSKMTPGRHVPQQFDRSNPLRITVSPMRQQPQFSREHRLRQSMPDKKYMYRPPERRPLPQDTSSRRSSIQETPVSSAVGTPLSSVHTTPTASCETLPIMRGRSEDRNESCSTPLSHHDAPDFDLNESLSSINSTYNGDTASKEDKINRILRTLKITSSETITTKLKWFTKNEKTKLFLDKILELQDKNQILMQENAEFRKNMTSLRFSEDRVTRLEKKILELELENQKLRKICDIYNNHGNPNDSRTYHYYSNV